MASNDQTVTVPVIMPVLGFTMEEGTVAEWLKQEGDRVQNDEPLLTIEMDKGTMEVTSPASGVLKRILAQPGQTVPVRETIAEIAADPGQAGLLSSSAPSSPAAAGAPETVADAPRSGAPSDQASGISQTAPGPAGERATTVPAEIPAVEAPPERVIASPRARLRARELGVDLSTVTASSPSGRVVEADVLKQASAPAGRVVATPVARRLAEERGVDLQSVTGSGPGGRITQDDVRRAAEAPPAAAPVAAAEAPRPAREAPPAAAEAPTPAPVAAGAVVPLSRLRRLTAERLAASSRTVARVTLLLEADLTEAARLRAQLQPEFARLGVPKLPWDALVAKAAGLALAEYPDLRAQWVAGQGLRQTDGCHVAVALALGEQGRAGLVAPVLRDAERRSLRELAGELLELVAQARAGRLPPSAYEGGTFTVSNLGAYRIDGFTPVIPLPQAAILGVGRIAEKPAVHDGQLTVRTQCTLSLAFDHRVVDGAPAAAFLARLAELLERPYALLGV